ncbi:MmcQ/YjbR family DNA-binding protein [Streptococcus cuniculi]|uniref:MmcQ family protein n=1 Tax=Streptococcus cuniculi TaxID=1432788 RepID=A0A4Y9JFH5_9STRE|nr:MmcQ/YjbR family DNA-binding protein [Streptococcus cuniculi]MBF0777166.1 MmcQ/YjbR family DNA-binding protein [Streptococcus cuniculi]TFU98776.1 MmcQ family protein [Streptococcus cuniculi]
MQFEEAFFKDKIWQRARLLDYGFKEERGVLRFCQSFMDGHFEARIQVDSNNQASAQIWDLDMDEEYHGFRIQRAVGAFVGEVRERYAEILQHLVQHCTEEETFRSTQGNRLVRYVKEHFQEVPDYPFTKAPDIATLRHATNQKWYGLVTQVPWTALGVVDKAGTVEIINVKVEAGQMKEWLAQEGIYPAYHMSKKTWVSISLDGSLADEALFALVSKSRDLVAPKTTQFSFGPCCWFIPANPKLYDIDTELRSKGMILWTQKPKIKAGDLVCIYMTAPIQAIRYLCRVTEAHILGEEKEFMQLELVRELADDTFPLAQMKELGVKAVRGPRLATPECRAALEKLLEEC